MDLNTYGKFKYISVVAKDPHNFESDMDYNMVHEEGTVSLLQFQFETLKNCGLIYCVTGEWPCSIWYAR